MPRPRHTPERTCIACGQKLPKSALKRVVRTPEGNVAADPSGKSPGRGAYLCVSEDCWRKGVQQRGLERGLKVSLSSQDQQSLLDFYRNNIKSNVTVEG